MNDTAPQSTRQFSLGGEPQVTFPDGKVRIPPRSGAAFELFKGEHLTVSDPLGEQVSDLICFSLADTREWLSSGRTIDYANRIYPRTGDTLYSNRSTPMLTITSDSAGQHDFLLTPCSQEVFARLYDISDPRPSCFGNLRDNLAHFGIAPDNIPTTLNLFMRVIPEQHSGELTIGKPSSGPGDAIVMRAETDLVVGLTACAAEKSNNFSFKPIDFQVAM